MSLFRKKRDERLDRIRDTTSATPHARDRLLIPPPEEMAAAGERARVHRALWLTIDVRAWLDRTMPAVWRQLVNSGPGPATVDGIDIASTDDAMLDYVREAENVVRLALLEFGYKGEPGVVDPTSFPALLHSRENAKLLPDPEQLRTALAEATDTVLRAVRLPSLAQALGVPETSDSWPQQRPQGR